MSILSPRKLLTSTMFVAAILCGSVPDEASAAFGMGRMSFGGGMHSFAGRGMHFGGASRMMTGSRMMGSRMMGSSRSMGRMGRNPFAAMGTGKAMSRKMAGHPTGARAERLGQARKNMPDSHMMPKRMADRPHRMHIASRPDDGRPHHRPFGPQLRIPSSYDVPNTLLDDQNTIPIDNPPTGPQVTDNPGKPPQTGTSTPSQTSNGEQVPAQSTVERVITENDKVVRREWFDPNNKDRIIKKAHYKDGTVVEEEFFDPKDGHRTVDKTYDPKSGRPKLEQYFDKDGNRTDEVQYNGNTGTIERISRFDPQTQRMISDIWLDPNTGKVVARAAPDETRPDKRLTYDFNKTSEPIPQERPVVQP